MTALDAAQRGRGPYVWRFGLFHRLLHASAILTFYTLVLTGIPLRFPCAPWSATLIDFFGGVHSAGLIHRVAGALTLVYGFAHFGYVALSWTRDRDWKRHIWGPDSIVPQPRDLRDFIQQWMYFFGRRRRPRFGRFSYMEKLDYWGELWGFVVIGGSGLMLWFPEWFSHWVPGWMFNVATIFHGYEAMIAIVFLFAIHFFNVHLRPDKFPMDAVMFTGRATVDYMEEEHPLLAETLGSVEEQPESRRAVPDARAPAPGMGGTIVAAIFGYFALAGGLAVLGMILWVLFC